MFYESKQIAMPFFRRYGSVGSKWRQQRKKVHEQLCLGPFERGLTG